MSIGFREAFGLLRRESKGFAWQSRLHLIGRFLSCPILPIVEALPHDGVVLDVGAGHGVLARLAVESRRVAVVAVEPDGRKLGSAFRHPSIRWVTGFDQCVGGRFEAAVLCDVLYLVPPDERDRFLARLFARLKPGGLLVVKDVDPGHRLKFGWNVLQEAIAIRVLRMTLGSKQTHESREAFRARLETIGFVEFAARAIDRGYPHPHVLYTARRPT